MAVGNGGFGDVHTYYWCLVSNVEAENSSRTKRKAITTLISIGNHIMMVQGATADAVRGRTKTERNLAKAIRTVILAMFPGASANCT